MTQLGFLVSSIESCKRTISSGHIDITAKRFPLCGTDIHCSHLSSPSDNQHNVGNFFFLLMNDCGSWRVFVLHRPHECKEYDYMASDST